jgi:hypothetical protein
MIADSSINWTESNGKCESLLAICLSASRIPENQLATTTKQTNYDKHDELLRVIRRIISSKMTAIPEFL